MQKSTPVSYLIKHQDTILKKYHQSSNKPKYARESLQQVLPELSNTMSYNTFKQYVAVFVALSHNLGKGTEGKARVNQKLDKVPKRISGWTVQKAKDGYFRCYRKIRNRVRCIYVGKVFDEAKARDRIIEKEKELGLYKS